MTLTEIKQISIRKYLNNLGIHPVKDYNYYGMYYRPPAYPFGYKPD